MSQIYTESMNLLFKSPLSNIAFSEIPGETDDDFDLILKKIEYLANNKNVGTPRSKLSDKKKKRSTSSLASNTVIAAIGSSTMFHMVIIIFFVT